MIKVKLLQHTPDAEAIVAAAAKLCYSDSGVENILDNLDDENVSGFLTMLIGMGHESPFQHVSFTFGIEGVSRSLLAQITRHRIASYSVKSQRYVSEDGFEFITPPEIEGDKDAMDIYIKAMKDAQNAYDGLKDILYKKHYTAFINSGVKENSAARLAEKAAIEDARFVLPNACETKMVVTMNARSLMNFFNHRCCMRAQWEIRELANQMLILVREVCPNIFKKAGPRCLVGSCPEGSMSCGKSAQMRRYYIGGENV